MESRENNANSDGAQVGGVHADNGGGTEARGRGFDTPGGTRGVRPHAGRGQRWLDRQLDALGGTWVGRKVYRRLMGCDALVLTTVGRRTGKERAVRLARFPYQGSWLIVAAAGGTASNPAWYDNLAAHPDDARVEVDGRTVPVSAAQLHGVARDEAWALVVATSPQFAQFQEKTDRQLPVIRLLPRSGSSTG